MSTDERHGVTPTRSAGVPEEVVEQARGQAVQTSERIKTTASSRVRDTLDTRSTQLADQITPYAEALRRAGHHLEGQGSAGGGRSAERLADQIQRLSSYLRQSDADGFMNDVEGFARKRPWAAGGIGLALGFMGARFLKASAESRYSTRYPSQPLVGDVPARDLPISRETDETTVGGW